MTTKEIFSNDYLSARAEIVIKQSIAELNAHSCCAQDGVDFAGEMLSLAEQSDANLALLDYLYEQSQV